jgi:hypothetical protein
MPDQDGSEDVKRKKDLIFYEVAINAWLTTRMEMDKSFLWISTAGIGVLLNLKSSTHCSVLWWIATLAFLIAVISIMYTFHENSVYIGHMVNDNDHNMERSKNKLKSINRVTIITFGVGLIFSFLTIVGR